MNRLIIHIGTHKTGTTTIQKTLSASRGRLNARGINYPDYSSIGHRSHYAHIGVANALAAEHPTITKAMAEQFFRAHRVREEAEGVTVISAESLYRHFLTEAGVPTRAPKPADYWPCRFRFIEYLRSLTGPAEIAIVLRRQCDFAESMYQEHVKVTRYGDSFEKFTRDYWYHFVYSEQIEAWQRYFDKVHIIKLSDIAGDDIARKFLRRLSLKPGRLHPTEMANVGLGKDAVILKRLLNGTNLPRERLDALMKLVQECEAAGSNREVRSFFKNAEDRRAFQARFAEGNARLAKLIGEEEKPLFEPLKKVELAAARYGDDIDQSQFPSLLANLLSTLLDRQSGKARSEMTA